MTSSKPPAPDRKLARDVARELDRRKLRRKLLLLGLAAAAIALAVMYLTCGSGFGLGGKGPGKGQGEGSGAGSAAPLVDEPPRRCAVRIGGAGITVDRKAATIEEAVAACKGKPGVDLLVTGAARSGEATRLRTALEAAGLEVYVREPEPPPKPAQPIE